MSDGTGTHTASEEERFHHPLIDGLSVPSYFLVFTVLLVVLATTSVALACVPLATLVSLEPSSSGAAGSRVTVQGLGFDANPIEIRWNGPDGPELGNSVGPNFSVPITIPEVPEGLYTVVVLSRLSQGNIGYAAGTSFQVTESGGSHEDNDSSTASTHSNSGGTTNIGQPQSSVSLGIVMSVVVGAGLLLVGGLVGVLVSRQWRRKKQREH